MLFISILVAIKFLEDKYFTNIFYSKICGIKIEILNKMEYEFVCGLNFEMYIEKDFFYKYQDLLLNSQEWGKYVLLKSDIIIFLIYFYIVI